MSGKLIGIGFAVVLVLATITGALAAQVGTFTFNRQQVEAAAFLCGHDRDYQCDSLEPFPGTFPDGRTTHNGRMTIRTPDDNPRSDGYVLFFFSEGYMPKAYRWGANDERFPDTTDVQFLAEEHIVFNKAQHCRAEVEELTLNNLEVEPHLPVVVSFNVQGDAITKGAFTIPHDHPVQVLPGADYREFYSTDVKVHFKVYRKGNMNSVIYEETQEFSSRANADGPSLHLAEPRDVSFTFTPQQDGQYVAVIETEVIDDQCARNAQRQSTSVEFVAVDDLTEDRIYSKVEGLRILEDDKKINHQLRFYGTYMSNYIENEGNTITPLATDLTFVIEKDGEEVHTQSVQGKASRHATGARTFEFHWTPTEEGIYTVTVTGFGVYPHDVHDVPRTPASAELTFAVNDEGHYYVTVHMTDARTREDIEHVSVSMGGLTVQTDANGNAVLGPLRAGRYTFVATHPQYARVRDRDVRVFSGTGQILSYAMTWVGGDGPEEPQVVQVPVTEPKRVYRAQFDRISIPDAYDMTPGSRMDVVVSVGNIGQDDLERARITVAVPHLGMYRETGGLHFDEGKTETRTLSLYVPRNAYPGRYPVMVSVYGDHYRDTTWREIYVRSGQ